MRAAWGNSGGTFDYESKSQRYHQILKLLASSEVWKSQDAARQLGRERAELEKVIQVLDALGSRIQETREMLDLLADEQDMEFAASVSEDLGKVEREIADLEFQRMFSGEMDGGNAFIELTAGSGGTESQDWTEMLLRMYLRWAESRCFATEITEATTGEVAGLKSATVKIDGSYAFGWLRTETGVHRLVRKSPFSSGNRRHTSFAAVFVSPEITDEVEIEINPGELRVDVYRASGAGGQHVNKTESAVRITHLPTGVVTQCQNNRSQHRNRDTAMKQLKAKLYELERRKQMESQKELEANKAAIGWGSQIRSYVLDQSRIKDLRTGYESGNTQGILDGDLNPFMEESLRQGL